MFDTEERSRNQSQGRGLGPHGWRPFRSAYHRSSKSSTDEREGTALRNLDTTPLDDTPRPWIAILGQWRKGCLRLPIPYVEAVETEGATTKVLSPFAPLASEQTPSDLSVVTDLDPYDPSPLEGAIGLMLCGGGDIDPELYGRHRHPRSHNVSQKRDRFELTFLREALDRDMPVFAICRGMQLLNVLLGGTLEQHLMDDPRRLDHYRDRPLSEPAHDVSFDQDTLPARIVGTDRIEVNTHHHQGLDDVASTLQEVGWAPDGVLEAVVSSEHAWVLGVQWHPEAMVPEHEPQGRFFRAFVEATRQYAETEAPAGVRAQSA